MLQYNFEVQHPIAELLPDVLLTINLAMGTIYGALLVKHPAVDGGARP